MTNRRILDTNLIIRHVVRDHPANVQIADELFLAADRGDVRLVLLPEVLAECVFVLESFYQHARADIADVLGKVLSAKAVELADLAVHQDALIRYRSTRFHFVDCVVASAAAATGVPVASFDRDLKKFADIRVEAGWKPLR